MSRKTGFVWLSIGLVAGIAVSWFFFGAPKTAAAGNDRHEDYIIATGPIIKSVNGGPELDAVWLLDYRAGKLLGTAIGREGRVSSWAEVDLVSEFGAGPGERVHFLMTTGVVGLRSVLYVAETTSGKFGVYTMSAAPRGGVLISRIDLVSYRASRQPAAN